LAHPAQPVVHAGETALEVAAITLGIIGLAAAGAVAWLVAAARSPHHPARPLTARRVRVLPRAGPGDRAVASGVRK
jgi:hypothetical protein